MMCLFGKLFNKNSVNIDFSQLEYFNEFLIIGEKYESKMNPKIKRMDLMKRTKIGDVVRLVEYRYKGSPVYMVVSDRLKCDLGILSSGAGSWVRDTNVKMVGYISQPHNNSYIIRLYKDKG